MWWRVELDKTGAVTRCQQVEAVTRGSVAVTFVQAESEGEACTAALLWNERRKAAARSSQRRVRDRRLAAGLCCRCGKAPFVTGRQTCVACTAKQQERDSWEYAASAKTRAPTLTPEQALELHRARARRVSIMKIRIDHVLERFDLLGAEAFRSWLTREYAIRDLKASVVSGGDDD